MMGNNWVLVDRVGWDGVVAVVNLDNVAAISDAPHGSTIWWSNTARTPWKVKQTAEELTGPFLSRL